jgi:plastocyanin
MRITASLLVCCTAAGVAVGALALDPIRNSPSKPAAVAAPTTTVAANARNGRRPAAGAATPAAAAAAATTIKGFKFESVKAAPGATVTVTNADSEDHTFTAKDGSFGVNVPGGGQNSFAAPGAPGTYSFFCQIHPGMTGTLVVG